jgi:hypothetical protein
VVCSATQVSPIDWRSINWVGITRIRLGRRETNLGDGCIYMKSKPSVGSVTRFVTILRCVLVAIDAETEPSNVEHMMTITDSYILITEVRRIRN